MKRNAAAIVGMGISALFCGHAAAEGVYGVTLQQTLVSWDHASPGTIMSGVPLWGMAANETIQGLDFRPATGELYGLGSFSRLYKIDRMTGQAMQVGANFSTPLNGSSFGFDFNPTVDRVRIVSDADQNLRVHPDTGAVTVDSALAYGAADSGFGMNPSIVGSAYTNNFKGATTTALYGIDAARDVLVLQSPPNNGVLTTIGSLGTDVTDLAGFDISGVTGVAYAAIRDVNLGRTTFWTINLTTGQGTMLGEVGGGSLITAMTVVPAPGAAALAGVAALGMARRRRA
ncbi:MAG: hypothetical protein AMXMBFR58_09190 [Phycisphaerae bacterium]